jgi:hypothetical protein
VTARAARPVIPLPTLPEPSPDEQHEADKAQRRGLALVALAERGVAEAARRAAELEDLLNTIAVGLWESSSGREAFEVFQRSRWHLRRRVPGETSGVVVCAVCHQVGEAVELVARRLRWRWPGLDAWGNPVHPARVVVARDIGDVPPGLCPDHEKEAVTAGIAYRSDVLELERGDVR